MAQSAIQRAERGDYSEVRTLLDTLRQPFNTEGEEEVRLSCKGREGWLARMDRGHAVSERVHRYSRVLVHVSVCVRDWACTAV